MSQATEAETDFNDRLLRFLSASPTPFHAVAELSSILGDAGFRRLDEGDTWSLTPGTRYLVTRNDSSLIAFRLGHRPLEENGIRLVGAHTDSPCLKVKPRPENLQQGYLKLGVEVYGGALLNPWFDRDLSLAGRITYRTQDNRIRSRIVDLREPVAVIPSLAIHLDREANSSRSINAQTDIPAVILQTEETSSSFTALVKEKLDAEDVEEILNYELSLYSVEPPRVLGWRNEFIASARLDNLLSCFVGAQSLIEASDEVTSLLVCNDHEEVGSSSAAGAHGTFLTSLLQRLCVTPEALARTVSRSLAISVDNSHGIHPNYPDKHDARHGPILNRGPVIKVNSNQRYATNSETAAFFKQICTEAEVPCQVFVNRTDMSCGSTIGPITATATGIRTLDIGIPQFAMHSIRELCGSRDPHLTYRALRHFFQYTGALGPAD